MEPLHTDYTARVVVNSRALPWVDDPGRPGAQIRTLAADGDRRTFVTKLPAGAHFESHQHAGGAEVLVLAGALETERGEFGPGTFMLRAEGSPHTTSSVSGCELFVRLGQYAGKDRSSEIMETTDMTWLGDVTVGVRSLALYGSYEFPERIQLTRMAPASSWGKQVHEGGCELFVTHGALLDEDGIYPAGSWLRLPPGYEHTPRSDVGCTVLRRTGGTPT